MKWPRRHSIPHLTSAELAISRAVDEVELAGCDVLLTEAVVLLGQAKDKVGDYVDKLHPGGAEVDVFVGKVNG